MDIFTNLMSVSTILVLLTMKMMKLPDDELFTPSLTSRPCASVIGQRHEWSPVIG